MLQGRIAGGRTGPPAAPVRLDVITDEATRRPPSATHRLTPATHRTSMCNGLHRRHEDARSLAIAIAFYGIGFAWDWRLGQARQP